MTGDEWADLIMTGNQIGLQWYATVNEVPIAGQPPPSSLMGHLTGTDLGVTGGSTRPIAGSTVVILLGLIVAAVVLFKN